MIIDSYSEEQLIGQLEKRKGGYFYVTISAGVVNQFINKRVTRFICTLDKKLTFQCGLNHLGDGNFFIILGSKNLVAIDKQLGDKIFFELSEDPNPLGVDIPEILTALLEQDGQLKTTFDNLTPGKKRNVIHTMNKIKDIDKQIKKTIQIIYESTLPRPKKSL
jgi:hypothetical protein